MTGLQRALEAVVVDLAAIGASWALVGGLAVSARSEPRFTRDLDLAVAVPNDERAETITRFLLGRGYRLVASVEQEATHRLATVRLLPPGESEGGAVVDLLFASSGVEPEIVEGAEVTEILRDVAVPLAQVGHLVALKVLSRDDRGRPQDRVDLLRLLAVADESQLSLARVTLADVQSRGFARGKDLLRDLEVLLREVR